MRHFQADPTRTSIPIFTQIKPLPSTLPQLKVFRALYATMMSLKEVSMTAAFPTQVAFRRAQQLQTSGSGYSGSCPFLSTCADPGCAVFKLPVELFFEIFSHLYDHRRRIRDTAASISGEPWSVMEPQHVERSTIIRKLTMTCWALRDTLLPILWRITEGCVVSSASGGGGEPRKSYGLYTQCVYLLLNPTIAAHVR